MSEGDAMKFREKLTKLGACQEAIEWVGDRTEEEAWEDCGRADWMLWYVYRAKIGTLRRRIEAVCQIAETVLPVWEEQYPDDLRPRQAIAAARQMSEKNTKENREAARTAAGSAADAADAAGSAAVEAAGYAAHKKLCRLIRKIFGKVNP